MALRGNAHLPRRPCAVPEYCLLAAALLVGGGGRFNYVCHCLPYVHLLLILEVTQIMVRLLQTEVPCPVSRKPSAGRNLSELKAAASRLARNDKYITDLTLSWNLMADEGARRVCVKRESEKESLQKRY